MIKSKTAFILFCLIFCAADISRAAGLLMRIQQMKKHKQQPQGMTQEEYRQHQLLLEQQGQPAENQPPAPPTYQQTIDQRNQAIAQAILDAHSPSVSSENIRVVTSPAGGQTPSAYAGAEQTVVIHQPPAAALPQTAAVKETADLSEVWKKLDQKAAVWSLLIDDQAKILTVSEYIDRFHKEGVKINEPPLHYVQMIDQIIQGSPQMQERPFGELLQIAAIVDYDFDNGMDKDVLARKVLGDAGFEANKKRFHK